MPRRGQAIPAILPFEYVVLGRPYSAQNKTRGYTAWYERVIMAVTDAVDAASRGRRFVATSEEVRVQIVWLSAQPDAPDHPDLDAIIKPMIDATSEYERQQRPRGAPTWVIKNDRQIRRIEAALVDLNTPELPLPAAVMEKQDDEKFVLGEVIYVRMGQLDAPDDPAWEWWK